MNKTEREAAEQAICDLTEVVELLNKAHRNCESLAMKHGWEVDFDRIAEASMSLARIALGIVDSIAEDDKWNVYWSKKDV